jgi:uncharacterized protein
MDIRYLILALTTRCNLHCVYCYSGPVAEPADMSAAVLDRALDLVRDGRGPFHLQLTGGEPTLVPQSIERAVRRARSLTRPCTIGIQTNGTLLDAGLVEFFRRFGVQVGVSLDGPPTVQESLRGEAAKTFRGLQLLESHGVPFRVTTVVSGANVGHLDRLVWTLAGFGRARGIGLDLLVRKGRAGAPAAVETAGASALRTGVGAMMAALDAANQCRAAALQLRELELIRDAAVSGGRPFFCHAAKGQSAAVGPDGRLFPCGQTMGDPRFAAGSLWQPEPDRLAISGTIDLPDKDCAGCPLEGRCPGDCPSRLHYNRSDHPELICELYRALQAHQKEGNFDRSRELMHS